MHTSPPQTHLKNPLKAIFLATAVAAALGVAAPSFADDAAPPTAGQHCGEHGHQGHHSMMMKHHHGMMMHDLHQLDLSDAQKKSIHAAFKSSREGMKTQFQGLLQQRRAFEAAVPGTPEFNSTYGSYAQAAAVAAQARIKAEADLRTQIYNLLTNEQRAKLATLQAQHGHHHDEQPARS